MTRSAFIERVINEVTEGKAIPIAPKPKRIIQIIDEANRYFNQNDDESHEFEYIIIPNTITNTTLFRQKRQVQLPSCVEAISGVQETGALLNTGSNNINADYRKTNFNYHLAVGGDSDSMLYGVVASYYADFIRNFVVRVVQFDYNPHSNMLTIKGRDHFFDLVLQAHIHTSQETKFNDEQFFRFVVGKTKISFTKVFGFVDAKLIGGLTIDISGMKSEGKEEVKDVKQELIDDRQTVDYWMEF